jgi:hypothetical protein
MCVCFGAFTFGVSVHLSSSGAQPPSSIGERITKWDVGIRSRALLWDIGIYTDSVALSNVRNDDMTFRVLRHNPMTPDCGHNEQFIVIQAHLVN